MFEDNELVAADRSNNSGQKLFMSKTAINSVKLKILKNYLKLSISKKTILDKFKILVN